MFTLLVTDSLRLILFHCQSQRFALGNVGCGCSKQNARRHRSKSYGFGRHNTSKNSLKQLDTALTWHEVLEKLSSIKIRFAMMRPKARVEDPVSDVTIC